MTSSPGGSACTDGTWSAAPFDCSNGFLNVFRKACRGEKSCLILSSDPDNTKMGDEMQSFFMEAFSHSGMSITQVDVCDRRDMQAAERLCCYGLLILAGGHVPTQNAFFHEIGLREKIRRYAGVVLGISAGTMNCAEVVYAQPEEPGEAVNPYYRRYMQGLGLTHINVLPHFQNVKGARLDGLRVLEDISLPDSRVRPFYGLPDGSWLYREDGHTTLHGEAWLLEAGTCIRICESGESREVEDER
ncbi:MAG: Type 1 glutamine amidotransferase-like domain-containing protein [Lachnospiraceae bacterium]|nr:Type 1 glutamine amidotransferase-like domain-containing protein [Lachnospiraceae bacterium]